MSTCTVCGRPLQTASSVAAGMGPKCASKNAHGVSVHHSETSQFNSAEISVKGKLMVLTEEERRFLYASLPPSQSTYEGCKYCGSTETDIRSVPLRDGTDKDILICAECGKDYEESVRCVKCRLPEAQCRCEYCEGCSELIDRCVCNEVIEKVRKKAAENAQYVYQRT